MNVRKLRAKMIENNFSVEALSNIIGVSKSTFYRKLTEKGEKFHHWRSQRNSEGAELYRKGLLCDIFLPKLSHICDDGTHNGGELN